VFGIDDVNKDPTVQFLLSEFHSLRNRVSVLEDFIEKQSEIIQAQNDRIVKLEATITSGSRNKGNGEKSSISPGNIEGGVKHSRVSNANPFDEEYTHMLFIPRRTSHERTPKSK
jgi:hypothetical protein